jgi:hypothetical protein
VGWKVANRYTRKGTPLIEDVHFPLLLLFKYLFSIRERCFNCCRIVDTVDLPFRRPADEEAGKNENRMSSEQEISGT